MTASIIANVLPANVSVSIFRATAGQTSKRVAVLIIDGNELPMLFHGDNADQARSKAVDYFTNDFQNSIPAVKVDGRKVSRNWFCHETLPSVRLTEDQVNEYLDMGYVAGKIFGFVPTAPKAEGTDHGNCFKDWYHFDNKDGSYTRVRLELAEIASHKRKGFVKGFGPRK